MQCGDLERYLEAYLDGRLGRSRAAGLRRHLIHCTACRARVERLRQFERDMQRRFRSMDQVRSVWQGLELDLVASARDGGGPGPLSLPRGLPLLPPRVELSPVGSTLELPSATPLPRPGIRGRVSRLVGVLFVALALGALYEMLRAYLWTPGETAALSAYREIAAPTRSLALASDDPVALQDWLSETLAAAVPELPLPDGYHPVGADRATLPDGVAGAVVYDSDAPTNSAPVVLFLQSLPPADGEPPASSPAREEVEAATALQQVSWTEDSLRYTLVGHGSREHLRQLVD